MLLKVQLPLICVALNRKILTAIVKLTIGIFYEINHTKTIMKNNVLICNIR